MLHFVCMLAPLLSWSHSLSDLLQILGLLELKLPHLLNGMGISICLINEIIHANDFKKYLMSTETLAPRPLLQNPLLGIEPRTLYVNY